ncbi:6-carboxytetrahydropterin synthase QueD [Candidatus Marinimicrobia bacterium]|jgi:6-pyruvoyltetrahydropterin/6-carboxytetrahydropterin synthase|nr:6-carboxytetrahydropterin synthase QueD [Candidatus Neomarinimicrobiota bacterium]MDC0383233.1 6-carboxytetrahydropterin synthase QueD [Candidatus Neomarinimicrobiota bacterium]MDC0630753.1 6-carboxytetrahydropterin synthase QueD [Candidatus Neomarinimicrobiota bacterium]|tara:strand:+ start:600 stop:950 length:351 start_codon:yes stop_codon:yes gene_type:complete
MEIHKIFSVEAARSLPNLPEDHPCKRIHGHSFKIKISVRGQVNKKTGFVIDFSEIDRSFNPILKQIDHQYLNDIKGLENPSSENMCKWIWEKLSLPGLYKITIQETDTTGCSYKGD